MAWSKTKTLVSVSAVVLLAGVTAMLISAHRAKVAREQDFVAYEIQHQTLMQKIFKKPMDENALRHQLVGKWEMAAARSWGATEYTYLPKHNGRFKIWTLTDWSIVTYDENMNPVLAASGPYTLKGNLYTETIESASGGMTKFLGAHPRFNIRVDGDKYYQMGLGKKPFIEEMWVRVKE